SFGRMNRLEAPMVIDTSGQIEKDYLVTLTPFAYLLDHERKVVIRGIANDWRQLESILEQEGTLQAGHTFAEVDGDGDAAAVTEMRESWWTSQARPRTHSHASPRAASSSSS